MTRPAASTKSSSKKKKEKKKDGDIGTLCISQQYFFWFYFIDFPFRLLAHLLHSGCLRVIASRLVGWLVFIGFSSSSSSSSSSPFLLSFPWSPSRPRSSGPRKILYFTRTRMKMEPHTFTHSKKKTTERRSQYSRRKKDGVVIVRTGEIAHNKILQKKRK